MGARRRAREHALKMLYQAELAGLDADETARAHFAAEPESEAPVRAFAERYGWDEPVEALVATFREAAGGVS